MWNLEKNKIQGEGKILLLFVSKRIKNLSFFSSSLSTQRIKHIFSFSTKITKVFDSPCILILNVKFLKFEYFKLFNVPK